MKRLLRGAFVIARRDFSATVLSKAFIFFLLAPVFPLLVGGIFGGITAKVATDADRPVIAVVASKEDFARLHDARERLADAVGDPTVVRLARFDPAGDADVQAKRLLASRQPPVRAVLSGGLDHPRLAGSVDQDSPALAQLRLILSDASSTDDNPIALPVARTATSAGADASGQSETARAAQMLLFFLTLLLSGMVMSQLIEEKSNKIIEVIAAALPIDSMFVGKLFAMLAASVVGIVVWVAGGAALIQMISSGGVRHLPTPALGWPGFLGLGILYFAMNYLLVGSVYLMIGAQASTAREVQTLSMPATFAQILIFGFAITASASPNSTLGVAAAIFPLSSPMVMLGRAAQDGQLWPHLLAIVWQALWVVLILRFGARLFRKTVLKSGPKIPWWRFGRA